MLIEVHTEGAVSTTGYLALDSFVGGEAHGGLRIAADVTAERLRLAARSMTLKYGWAGLPVGGAKAGILMSPATSRLDRALMLRDFGRAIEPYLRNRRYVPGEDMGSSVDDIKAVLKAAGLTARPRSLMFAQSGLFTGVSVCAAALAAADSLNLPAKGLRVTIEGFGNVGASAAAQFHAAGALVVAVSSIKGAVYHPDGLDVPELLSLRRRMGDDAVLHRGLGTALPAESIAGLPADVFCPCAIMHGITGENAGSLRAPVVSPGANVPATEEAEEILRERGVLLIPDFVANCGGVLGSSMSRGGLGQEEITHLIQQRIRDQVSLLLLDAHEQRRTLADVATQIALQRFEVTKERYERRGPRQALMRLGVEVYRRGLIPPRLLAPLGRRYYGTPPE